MIPGAVDNSDRRVPLAGGVPAAHHDAVGVLVVPDHVDGVKRAVCRRGDRRPVGLLLGFADALAGGVGCERGLAQVDDLRTFGIIGFFLFLFSLRVEG